AAAVVGGRLALVVDERGVDARAAHADEAIAAVPAPREAREQVLVTVLLAWRRTAQRHASLDLLEVGAREDSAVRARDDDSEAAHALAHALAMALPGSAAPPRGEHRVLDGLTAAEDGVEAERTRLQHADDALAGGGGEHVHAGNREPRVGGL